MKMKKIITGVFTCAMICGAVPYADYVMPKNVTITASAASYTEGTYESLTYKAYSDHIEISDCDGSATEVTIPSEIDMRSVTNIASYAFLDCSGIKEIILPESLISIKDSAFSGCSDIKEITVPENVIMIKDYAFNGCTALETVKIFNDICEISGSAKTISDTATIYGHEGSTAQAYAEKYNRTFLNLEDAPDEPSKGNSTLAGDANCDGVVDIADVVAVAAYVGDPENNSLAAQAIINGDVQNTGDGLTAGDILMIQQYVANIITEF